MNGKQLSKSFSVLIYGYDEAKASVIAARKEPRQLKEALPAGLPHPGDRSQ